MDDLGLAKPLPATAERPAAGPSINLDYRLRKGQMAATWVGHTISANRITLEYRIPLAGPRRPSRHLARRLDLGHGAGNHLDSAPGHAVAARFGQEFVKKNGAPDRVVLEGLRQAKDWKWVWDRVWWEYAGGRRVQYPDWADIAGK